MATKGKNKTVDIDYSLSGQATTMPIISLSVENIKICIYRWGIYPALIMLRELQNNEQYEQCAIIKKALDEVMNGRGWYVDTKTDDNSLNRTYQNITNGKTTIQTNMPYYISEFRKNMADLNNRK